jgi:hypothetical protein
MKLKIAVVVNFLFLLNNYNSAAQKLSQEEEKLYDLIMDYRQEFGLPIIPLSSSLTIVAQTHVNDLETSQRINNSCNMHSWSNNGPWTPCCYTSDHAQAACMWDKPRELTSYQGNGYEIAFGSFGAQVRAESALAGWKGSHGHKVVIVNQENWTKKKWNAIGIGISKSYAVVWFGDQEDNQSLLSTDNSAAAPYDDLPFIDEAIYVPIKELNEEYVSFLLNYSHVEGANRPSITMQISGTKLFFNNVCEGAFSWCIRNEYNQDIGYMKINFENDGETAEIRIKRNGLSAFYEKYLELLEGRVARIK